jgi:hypothetical protein
MPDPFGGRNSVLKLASGWRIILKSEKWFSSCNSAQHGSNLSHVGQRGTFTTKQQQIERTEKYEQTNTSNQQ